MTLPNVERVLFAQAPLMQVIAQVRFPLLVRFSDSSFLAPFHEAIQHDYPKASREHQANLLLSASQGARMEGGEIRWKYTTRNDSWAVVLAENAITLEVRHYTSFEELAERFSKILTLTHDVLGVEDRSRLGLRYINQIRVPNSDDGVDWREYVKPELLGVAASGVIEGNIKRMTQEIQISRPDGMMTFRHGILNGSVGEAEAPFYLLDFDYFDDSERSLDEESTIAQMTAFHDLIHPLFRWSIQDRLYKLMEPRNGN